MEAVKKKKAQAWEQGYNFHLHVALPVFFCLHCCIHFNAVSLSVKFRVS